MIYIHGSIAVTKADGLKDVYLADDKFAFTFKEADGSLAVSRTAGGTEYAYVTYAKGAWKTAKYIDDQETTS